MNFRKPKGLTRSGILSALCWIICSPWLLFVLAYVWTEDGATHTTSYIFRKWQATDMYKKREAMKDIKAMRKAFEEVLRYKVEDGIGPLKKYPSKGAERLQRVMRNRSKPKDAWGHKDSGFCKLPAEIRLRIYEMVIGQVVLPPHVHKTVATKRRYIHIHKHIERKTLFGFPCVHDGPISKHWNTKLCQCRSERGEWIDWSNVWHHHHSQLGIGMIPLALSCRFIGEEVLDWMYTWPTFVFHRTDTLLLFLFMLPSRYRDRVRSVYVDGRGTNWIPPLTLTFERMPRIIRNHRDLKRHKDVWTAAFALLSDARGLREVKASLCDQNFVHFRSDQRAGFALGSLLDLQKTRRDDIDIEVEVDWDLSGANSSVERELSRNGLMLKKIDRSRVPDLEGTHPLAQELFNSIYRQQLY